MAKDAQQLTSPLDLCLSPHHLCAACLVCCKHFGSTDGFNILQVSTQAQLQVKRQRQLNTLQALGQQTLSKAQALSHVPDPESDLA